ncbi:MAG: ABC transporter transmembrane domain-containing protein, partial [Pseudomonadota bacterium]|nr:ABC transporter transmembrane domain-containing protein [Pseudomonadota bacterium]
MEPTIFKFILKYSKREQMLLLLLTAVSMPFTYMTLEVPKLIINKALSGRDVPDEVLGFPLDQISYLFVLCGLYFLLTVITGGIKYFLNVYRGIVGEKMLLRLRYEMYGRVLRFPIPVFKRLSPGEIIPMIVAETQEIGGFIGDAIALPAFQGGLLVTYLLFIFNQDPILGLFAIAFYPLQLYLTPKIQRKISARLKERIVTVRALSQRIEETVSGITEIHAHDTSHYERADISSRLGKVFGIRADIYKKKFLIKFINNSINKITPVLF